MDFAIYTEKMGIREDVPKMLLSEAFLASESRNIHDEFGEFRRLKGRIPFLFDSNGQKIQTPKAYYGITAVFTVSKKFVISDGLGYAITGINQGSKTITIAGNHKTAIDAAIASSNTTEIYLSTGNDGAYTFVSATNNAANTDIVVSEAIPSVTADGKIFLGSEAHATEILELLEDNQIRVNGSTGNDQLYTVVSVTDVGGSTEIVVDETVADSTADGNVFVGSTPVICYHAYIKQATGVKTLLCGTAYHIWVWDGSSRSLVPKFTSSGPENVSDMTILTHLDYVYMTNNVDKIQWWDTASLDNVFTALGSASGVDLGGGSYIIKARYLCSYESYLFIGCPTLSAGDPLNQRAYWSSRGTSGNSVDFDATGSGDTGFKDFNREQSFIVGFATKGTDLIVAKGKRMMRGWLTTDDVVFEWKEEDVKVGCLSGKTLINDSAGRLYWLASDFTIRELDTIDPISGLLDKTVRNLNPEYVEFAQATYIDTYKEVWFAVPSQESSGRNDIVIAFNTLTFKLYIYSIEIRAFCSFSRQEVFTYDSLPYASYEEWGIAWLVYDTKVNALGYLLDIGSDYSGNTFELHAGTNDNGSAWVGKLVISTTLTAGKSPYIYKRAPNGVDLSFNSQESGTALLYLRKDGNKDRELLGTASLIDSDIYEFVTQHITFDKRAKVFYFDIESSGNMEFIGMVFREIYIDGDR